MIGEKYMKQIRLVALDLDGTVFNDQKEISPRTLAAIRAALEKVWQSCLPPGVPSAVSRSSFSQSPVCGMP